MRIARLTNKTVKALWVLFFIPHFLFAQLRPKEGAKLNYRIIGFSYPQAPKATRYKIEIAVGHFDDEDSFRKNVVKSVSGSSKNVIAEVPSFGKEYTWRTISYLRGSMVKGPLNHFETEMIPNVDTTVTRLRIIKRAAKYKDSYVFIDGSMALYDMNGNPVWFLPLREDLNSNKNLGLRDMKLSPFGTITFILDQVFEIDYDANILWKGPEDQYRHEFTRLHNGHYMALRTDVMRWNSARQDSLIFEDFNRNAKGVDTVFRRARVGRIVEYDESGKVVWSWRTSSYLNGSDVINCMNPDGSRNVETHDNSFYFDEKDSIIYVSFKNIGRVIRIKYPEGTVLNVYGEKFQKGGQPAWNYYFCTQHCVMVSKEGNLYLFNNNGCHPGALPTIVVLKQPSLRDGNLEKIWEYTCVPEEKDKPLVNGFGTGGSVQELPDGSIFASMSSEYSMTFIVNKEKQILWSALPEKWDPSRQRWAPVVSFKANMISRKNLEDLIWNAEKK